ncbi:MAG TPA: ROK family transcriptional regulator [Gemmatimonadaceae bacterium]|jgi:predicted NBD/HSP70 family sugar kinase|nr:ROK family transcriptional regulator [Gemmatimonadaceae bacterium]
MRKINTRNVRLATRSTPREVNRRIVLNLIREYQPISRAELARRMQVHRGTMTPLVRELVESGVVFEKGTAATARGRRPTLLCVRTRGRLVVAVDVRAGRSAIALADVGGHVVARGTFETPDSPSRLPELLAAEVGRLLRGHAPEGIESCQGIGIVLPGMVDRKTGRLIYAPRLGWRDVDLRTVVAQRVGMRCFIESAPIACALARLWLEPDTTRTVNSFAYVSVSDGLGVGLAVNGEILRGEGHTAGEFGHVPLDASGPACVCGRRGCWEALTCNATTVDRYLALAGAFPSRSDSARRPSIDDVVRCARDGDPAAIAALVETARHLGKGLALVVNAFNPGRIYVGGEVTAAWELMERPIVDALEASTITARAAATPVVPDSAPAEYRLRGAVALVTAPGYAALAVG